MHTLQIEGIDAALSVVRFSIVEGLSCLYRAEITFTSADPDIDLEAAVGSPALLLFTGGGAPRPLHGILAEVDQGASGKQLFEYAATLVPSAFRLLHRQDSRIFQEMSVPAILSDVFTRAGIPQSDVEARLTRAYPPREYCVQYRETDWAFASRLMEEEGIFYAFEHHPDRHVLVLGDSPSAYALLDGDPSVPFRSDAGVLVKEEHISRVRYTSRIRPGKSALRNHSFKTPALSLEATSAAARDADLELYDYPGPHDTEGRGATLAALRLEESQSTRSTASGEGTVSRFSAGRRFRLADHPRDARNVEYVLSRVTHAGAEPSSEQDGAAPQAPYRNTFECLPATVPFRPARATPRPTIKGIQTATVTGPPGEEIHTDAHGRVKVQFHWDRLGKMDDRSSCWLRVSQVWAGPAWGAIVLPRVGHEVVVDFLEGDPDRPLVVGSVYHAANVPPNSLPAQKTKTTLKSNSTPGGGGSNELTFEDRKGEEQVYLHAQKDCDIAVENDKTQEVGHDESLHVGHDRDKVVENDQSEHIGGEKKIQVDKNHTETIAMNNTVTVGMNQTTTVGMANTLTVALAHTQFTGLNHMLTVGMAKEEIVGAASTFTVGGALTIGVGAAKVEGVAGTSSETVGGAKSLTAGAYSVIVGKDMSTTVAGMSKEEAKQKTFVTAEKLAIQCGTTTVTVDSTGAVTIQGANITIQGTGTVQVSGASLSVKADGAVNLTAGGNVKVQGGNVVIN